MGQHPLLVVFHDPPSINTQPDPVSGVLDLHNMWLVRYHALMCCLVADKYTRLIVPRIMSVGL